MPESAKSGYDQVSNASTAGIGTDSGNYIVFEGLTADTFVVRTEEFAVRSPINGLQIVASVVLEPSTVGLLGLGLAGLLTRRRRTA